MGEGWGWGWGWFQQNPSPLTPPPPDLPSHPPPTGPSHLSPGGRGGVRGRRESPGPFTLESNCPLATQKSIGRGWLPAQHSSCGERPGTPSVSRL